MHGQGGRVEWPLNGGEGPSTPTKRREERYDAGHQTTSECRCVNGTWMSKSRAFVVRRCVACSYTTTCYSYLLHASYWDERRFEEVACDIIKNVVSFTASTNLERTWPRRLTIPCDAATTIRTRRLAARRSVRRAVDRPSGDLALSGDTPKASSFKEDVLRALLTLQVCSSSTHNNDPLDCRPGKHTLDPNEPGRSRSRSVTP